MSIHQVVDLAREVVLSQHYDLAVFASGYESRCVFAPSLLNAEHIQESIVLGFNNLAETKLRRQHDEYFRDCWGTNPVTASSGSDFAIQQILHTTSQGKELKRILVDCSSMSRLWYAGILNWARYGTTRTRIEIDFVYSVGRYEDRSSPMIIEDMLAIPGCEGGAFRSQKSIAIFGLGFNGWASLSVSERLEADEVFACIVSPGPDSPYEERVRACNKDFLMEPRLNKQMLTLPLKSIETCYRYLCELVSPHRHKDTVTLVPMGPKPHVLASILVSMKFPEISCLRVNMSRQWPEKVEAVGELVTTRVVVQS